LFAFGINILAGTNEKSRRVKRDENIVKSVGPNDERSAKIIVREILSEELFKLKLF